MIFIFAADSTHNDEILSLILEEYIMEDTITTQLFISFTFSNKGSTAQRLVSGIQLHRANAKERRKTTKFRQLPPESWILIAQLAPAIAARSLSLSFLPSISRLSSSIAPKKMKALSKNSRGGKRGSSNYSSSASTAAVLIVVSLCLFAVYALTSSSSSSLLSLSQSSTAAEPHFLLKDIPQTGSAPPSEEDSSQNLDDEKQEEENGNSGQQESLTKILIEEQSKIRDIDWDLCNVTSGPDYIPCLDNVKAIKKLNSLKHYEHRERHCPEESPTCLVPLPKGYKRSIEWPASRDKIWYNNVPRTKLAEVKGHQNWVKVDREYLIFPGGGTQFIHGALHYIDFIRQSQRYISWGKRIRVVLDVGCGVASFGGYLFERDVLTMSFAPKDEHEAQVQFALERGIPAISAVMGSRRLSFPSNVFDLIHCARCRVPWHADGGMLLLEVNRVLRPGGYFVWSATPVYQKLKEDVGIWKAMTSLTMSMCWDLVTIKKDKLNGIAAAIYRKPTTNECYDKRKNQNPPMCDKGDDPNAAWNVLLKNCMHRVPTNAAERGTKWPIDWPKRLAAPPYWLNASHIGIYGKPAPNDFKSDYEHWKNIVMKSYLNGLGINWSKLRNVMDMRSVYGGFAAALKDLKVWVMNVVNVDSPDTLPVIYERGLFGIYHDWCESFSTYPRSYDLLHADHLFSKLKERCSIVPVVAEIDRITRPGGKLVVKDESVVTSEVESLLKSLHWEVQLTFTKEKEGIITAEKSNWRPKKYSASS